MTRALIITDAVRADIAAALARAMDKVLTLEQVQAMAADKVLVADPSPLSNIKLSDRKPGFERLPKAEVVFIPMGYRANISFEQQPVGLCKHLSVSVDRKGMLPSNDAMHMLAEEFGMDKKPSKRWLEEFEPGCFAVNMVEPV